MYGRIWFQNHCQEMMGVGGDIEHITKSDKPQTPCRATAENTPVSRLFSHSWALPASNKDWLAPPSTAFIRNSGGVIGVVEARMHLESKSLPENSRCGRSNRHITKSTNPKNICQADYCKFVQNDWLIMISPHTPRYRQVLIHCSVEQRTSD